MIRSALGAGNLYYLEPSGSRLRFHCLDVDTQLVHDPFAVVWVGTFTKDGHVPQLVA